MLHLSGEVIKISYVTPVFLLVLKLVSFIINNKNKFKFGVSDPFLSKNYHALNLRLSIS